MKEYLTERTVAIALPHTYSPEFNREFVDWCRDEGVEASNTRLEAEVAHPHPLNVYYTVWQLTAAENQLVAVKLRWNDEMAQDWRLNSLEQNVAELLFWEVNDRI